jgi:O-antigen ligase/Tfp pilus assembly protein PilF
MILSFEDKFDVYKVIRKIISMGKTQKSSSVDWQFLGRESALLLLWSYLILIAGSFEGLTLFSLQLSTAIIGGVIIGIWLFTKLTKKQHVASSGIEIGIIAFLGAQIISMAFSSDVRRSVGVVGQFIVYFLIFYLVIDLLRGGWTATRIERTFLIVGGIVLGLSLYQHLNNYLAWQILTEGLTYSPEFKSRLYAVFADAPLLAAFTNLLLPFAMVRFLSATSLSRRLLWGGYSLAALTVEYLSDTRGGFLGTIAIIGIIAVLWVGLVSDRARGYIIRIWSFLKPRPIVLMILLLVALTPVVWVGMKAFQFQGDATHAPILSSRTDFWNAAWEGVKSSPVFGTGPGTYSTGYIAYKSIPPDRPYIHAHNMLINFAAESGVVGLVGIITFAVFLLRRVWKMWVELEKEKLIRWVAIIACLLGHLVHTIADHFLYPLATAIPLIVFLAILLNSDERPHHVSKSKPIHTLWLGIPALLVALLGGYSLRAYSNFNQGLKLFEQGDLKGAVEFFDSAAQKDPGMAHYWFTSGYTYGLLSAVGNDNALDEAINRYERGIAIEPVYGLNHANLGMLYWSDGNYEKSIEQLNQATVLAKWEDLFWLNLGFLFEETGQNDLSVDAYKASLSFRPENITSAFWESTSIRQFVKEEKQEDFYENPDLTEIEGRIEQARNALLRGDIKEAEDLFIATQEKQPHFSLPYLGLGELAIAQGDLDSADRYLKVALSMQSLTYDDKVWPLLAWAQVGLMQGEEEDAFERFRLLYEMVTEYPIAGWGRKGRTEYAWIVFRRTGLPLDVLPQVIRIDLTPELATGLLPLIEMYEEQGEFEAAEQVRDTLMAAIP